MRKIATLFLVMALASGFVLLVEEWTPAGANEALRNEIVVQDELDKKIEALTKRVDQLESDKTTLTLKNETQAALLGEIYGWLRTVNTACESLDASMDSARTNGFEKAGPNPRAKKEVLKGLQTFAANLRATNPTTAKKTAKK